MVTRLCWLIYVGAVFVGDPHTQKQWVNPRFERATRRLRNVIESYMGWLEESRQLAAHHAKLVANYLATIKLAMIRRCSLLMHDPSDRTY